MDLRSVLNTSDNGERAAAKAPPAQQQQQHPHAPQHHPQHPQQHPQQQHAHQHPRQHPQQHRGPPQASPQYAYRDYPHHPPQPSPGKPGGPEYQHPGPQYPPGAYPPQSPYQGQPGYPQRASHTGSFPDPRSPGPGGAPPAQSPYRHSASVTPGPGPGPGSSQGYFPGQQAHELRSPSQRHQYPPAQYQPPPHHAQQQHQRHDSHPPPPVAQPTTPYLPHNSIPQTPPIAVPGGTGQQQAQQRTHSAHSTPTPTSAHSQHPYGSQFPQGSPAPQHQPPPSEYRRQPSQPPGHQSQPRSAHSQQGPPPFSQPSSPYQQKMPSAGAPAVAQAHSSPNGPPQPLQQHRLSHPRPPSQPAQDSPPPPDSAKRTSMSEREHSMSVSPKTRVGSIPSNADHRMSISEGDFKARPVSQPPEPPVKVEQPTPTPAKRKLGDRSMSPSELEHRNSRPPPGDVNGRSAEPLLKSETPAAERKGRLPYSEPPPWAQNLKSLGKTLPKHANYVLQKRAHSHINGRRESSSQAPRPSIQEGEAQKPPAQPRSSSQAQPAPPAPPPEAAGPQELLGPWEASITGVKPYEEMSRAVADFLFIHVINAQDAQEISSRGIEFEIEAKLGTLIDKDTNHRVEKLVDSECVLRDTGRVAFQSSMTEVRQTHVTSGVGQADQNDNNRHTTKHSMISSTPLSYRQTLARQTARTVCSCTTNTAANWTSTLSYRSTCRPAYLVALGRDWEGARMSRPESPMTRKPARSSTRLSKPEWQTSICTCPSAQWTVESALTSK